jgi:hypothetical protein
MQVTRPARGELQKKPERATVRRLTSLYRLWKIWLEERRVQIDGWPRFEQTQAFCQFALNRRERICSVAPERRGPGEGTLILMVDSLKKHVLPSLYKGMVIRVEGDGGAMGAGQYREYFKEVKEYIRGQFTQNAYDELSAAVRQSVERAALDAGSDADAAAAAGINAGREAELARRAQTKPVQTRVHMTEVDLRQARRPPLDVSLSSSPDRASVR